VIHTVGPVWRGGGGREEDVLASCYTESLKIAGGKEPSSIAFPAISTGIYGYPQELAAGVAVNAVISYLKSNRTTLKLVQFVVYDSNALKIYTSMLNSVVT
jgi:O-acetyl-ADP-ribose deacetylase (regulator of RNase III)